MSLRTDHSRIDNLLGNVFKIEKLVKTVHMLYVDNNEIRTNCDDMVHEFLAKVKQDGRIRLNIEDDLTRFLGVRYTDVYSQVLCPQTNGLSLKLY